jgi:hypothetical protein
MQNYIMRWARQNWIVRAPKTNGGLLRKYVFYLLCMRSPGDLHNICADAVPILRMPIGALSKSDSESSLYAAGNWWSKITAQSVIYCTIYCTKSTYCARFHPKMCNAGRLMSLKPNGPAKLGRFSRPPVSTAHIPPRDRGYVMR